MNTVKNSFFAFLALFVWTACNDSVVNADLECDNKYALNYGSMTDECYFGQNVAFYWNQETKYYLKKLGVEVLNIYIDGQLTTNFLLNRYFTDAPACFHLEPNVVSFDTTKIQETMKYRYKIKCENYRELFQGSFVLSITDECKAIELDWDYPVFY